MKRWPLIRHGRHLLALYRFNRHYQMLMALGYYPDHIERDIIALIRIWFGRD